MLIFVVVQFLWDTEEFTFLISKRRNEELPRSCLLQSVMRRACPLWIGFLKQGLYNKYRESVNHKESKSVYKTLEIYI